MWTEHDSDGALTDPCEIRLFQMYCDDPASDSEDRARGMTVHWQGTHIQYADRDDRIC